MEFLLDTADIRIIEKYHEMIPYIGVTSNPALIRKAGVGEELFSHFREIRRIIGGQRSLHMQVISHKADEMIREAETILERVDNQVYIKVPVTSEGMKAMKVLKEKGIHLTATAVVTELQAILPLALDVDYIAPYYSKMCDRGIDGKKLIQEQVDTVIRERKKTKILAANIKTVTQVKEIFESKSQCITLNPMILEEALWDPAIDQAIVPFDHAWEDLFGHQSICDLEK